MRQLWVLGFWVGSLLPSTAFASLQCTDIFTVREETVQAQSVMVLNPEHQSILEVNLRAVQEFQMSDALFVGAKSYEDITYAVKNKVRTANELVDVVIQNIIYLKHREAPAEFQAMLSKMSADFINLISATWRISSEQMTMVLEIRLDNQMREMQLAYENHQARQSYIGFLAPRNTGSAPSEKMPIGFGPRKAKTPQEEAMEAVPKVEEAPTEFGPVGFIRFAERSGPVQKVEPGFVPRKEAPNNTPRFLIVIDPKTGDLNVINPDVKLGY